MKHLYTLLECAKEAGVQNVYVHGILDGVDTANGRYNNIINFIYQRFGIGS